MRKTTHRTYLLPGALVEHKTPVWRSRLVFWILLVSFLAVIARAAWVQLFNSSFYQDHGEARFARTLALPADRGKIYDRNNFLLASSVELPSFWANPEGLVLSVQQQKQLAQLLDMPMAVLQQKRSIAERHFVWLKRRVEMQTAKHIDALKIKGLYQVKEYQRRYPEGQAMAQILGLTNTDNQGIEGIEYFFDAVLSGEAGARRVYKDQRGAVVEQVGNEIQPQPGQDIVLSIDSRIQSSAYQKLHAAVLQHKAKAGSTVVLDVQTGEVLAMVNAPSYQPDARQNLRTEHLRNRAVTDEFEPGSTIKPFVVALALMRNQLTPSTVIPTASGRIKIGNAVISDVHTKEDLTVAQVIQKSSNVGMVEIALALSSHDLWAFYQSLGFGQKPQLNFPGMATGRLRHYKNWRPIEKATMSYGYGISASLLQLAQAYSILARDGVRIPITLLKRSPDTQPVAGTRIVLPEVAQQVRAMLHLVTLPDGTAPKAQTIGYAVGGKTGTVYKLEGRHYAKDKYRSLFVGLAPIENPRIVAAVLIDEPDNGEYLGGSVAAPVFSATVQETLRLLGVAPDRSARVSASAPAQVLAQPLVAMEQAL